MRETLRRRVVVPIVAQLRQGITPSKIALSVALGGVLGLFPVIGATTGLCFFAALALRLNHVAIQAVNYLVYPAQIVLLVPFMQAGQIAFGADPRPIGIDQVVAAFEAGWWTALEEFWHVTLLGVVAWSVAAGPVAVIVYAACLPLMRRVLQSRRTGDGRSPGANRDPGDETTTPARHGDANRGF